jgi:ABC-type glycerol-3-phosphate transport system substrate-binding protein
MLDCVWVSEFAQAGYLFPLKTLDSDWVDREYTTDIYPASKAANAYQGDLYGIQFETDISLLWYHKDWFDQEGITPPRNWDELLKVAHHFMQPEVAARYATGPHALAFPGGTAGGEATVYNLTPFIWSAGGEFFKNGYVTLNSPATFEALEFLRSLIKKNISPVDVVGFTWDQVPRQFGTGKFAMTIGGSYEAGVISEAAGWSRGEFSERVGQIPIPAAPGREPAATLGGMSCAVFRQSRHPELAIGVLQTAMQTDLLLEFCRLTMQHTPRPSLTGHFVATSEPFLAETGKMLSAARARPAIPEYAIISRQLQEMFQSILTTTTPIPEVVSRTCDFINVVTDTLCLDHS